MNCEVCELEESIFTIIPIGEGMPQSLGPACFARAGLEFAKTVLPAEEIAASLGPLFVNPPAPVNDEEGVTTASRKRRKATKEAEAPEGSAGGPPEIPAAAENE